MSAPLPHSSPRRSERVALAAIVSLRRAGQLKYTVRVHDASQHGCKVEFVERPQVGEQVWIKFDGMEALEAEVCWIEGFDAGLNFARPIHPAVFEQLMTRIR